MSEAVSERDNLPKGWVLVKIDYICKLIGGGTPSRKNLDYFNGDIVWLTPTEISKNSIQKIYDSKEKITKLGLEKSSARMIPINSVLLTTRASIGYVAIAGTNASTNQGFASFSCNGAMFNYYLAYWLWSKKNFLESEATGTTFKEISKSKLREIQIPLPPLAEQKRLVSKIESIFTQIDGAGTRLEAASGMLNKLRSSVLRQAFEGKLVSQDPNDEPVEAILKRIRRDSEKELVFERDNLPKGWIKTTIDNVCLIILGRSPPSSTYNQDKVGLPFFQGKADFGTFHPTTRSWCTNPETFAEKNDILISVRAPVGPTNISLEKCCIGRGLAAVRSLDGVIFSYVFYHLRFLENYIATKGTGTTFKAIRGAQLRSIALSIPSLNEQKRIVSKIESIFTRIDAVERYIESTLRLLDLLKSSTLKQAFEGKLVPQDPDDEPAEFLLQIMKQEKQLIKSQKSSYGRKNVR